MTTKTLLITLFSLSLICTLSAQEVQIKEVNPSTTKKFKNAPKRVYIASFKVIYQLLYSQVEKAEGGRELGGGYRGDAVAGLNMAIKGLEESDLMELTNNLYNDYKKQLADQGYSFVTNEEAGKSKFYEDFELIEGGTLNEDQYAGLLTAVPNDYQYYIKKVTKKGKQKGYVNPFKLSIDLEGAVVNHVKIVVPFVRDAESGASKALSKGLGGVAKIVVKPDLRIASEGMGAASMFDVAKTSVSYHHSYALNKGGAGTTFELKRDVDIPGIIEEKKYKASESADQDLWGTSYGALTKFNVSDKYLSKTHAIEVDTEAYKKSVGNACNAYLTEVVSLFTGYTNK